MSTSIGRLSVMVSANSSGFTAGFATMSNSLGGFISQVGKLGAVVGITSGIGEGLKSMFGGAAEMESNQVAFETLLGSGERAKKLMGELATFGAETPFQLPELTKAGKSLAAFGMDADQIVPKLRRIGDISSLLNQPIGEMATLYGKAKVAGVLMSEDINQFTERGVPLIQALAKQFGVAEVEVKKLASQGKISFADMDNALTAMTSSGGRFAGGMEKQSKTLGGMWSTLTDNVGMTLTKVGEGLVTAFSGKDAIGGLIEFTGRVQENAALWASSIGGFAVYVRETFSAVSSVVGSVWTGITGAFEIGFALIGQGVDAFGNKIGGFKETFIDAMLSVRFVFNNFGDFFILNLGKMTLKAWGFANDMVHFFTVTIPEAMQYFASQVVKILDYVANYAKHGFQSFVSGIEGGLLELQLGLSTIGEKIGLSDNETSRKIFDKLVESDRQRMAAQAPVFQPFDKMGKFTERQLSEAEKGMQANLDAIANRLAVGRDKFFAEGKAEFASKLAAAQGPGFWQTTFAGLAGSIKSGPGGAAPGIAAMAGKQDEWKRAGAIEAGSKQAYDVILKNRDLNSPAAQTATNTARTAKNTEEMKTGIKAIADGAAKAPTVTPGSIG